ncbi:MAG: phosphoribosyltransferase family protein [Myxococcota bacterium]
MLLTDDHLRDRLEVFADRAEAGRALAKLLHAWRGTSALVLAIPSGGVPVGTALVGELGLDLDVAPVSKVLCPWTTEAGFGAVALDGTEWIDADLRERHHLTDAQVAAALAQAREKVQRRVRRFRGARPLALASRAVILVDDGIAGGATMRTAISAIRKAGASELVVAAPTAHEATMQVLEPLVDVLAIANVRGGRSFAVADAYRNWSDVTEEEAWAALSRRQLPTSQAGTPQYGR